MLSFNLGDLTSRSAHSTSPDSSRSIAGQLDETRAHDLPKSRVSDGFSCPETLTFYPWKFSGVRKTGQLQAGVSAATCWP